MSEVLIHYETVNPISWVYLSSLLLIGLFFKFGRFWSVRNLDIALLILLAPGLLMVHYGQKWGDAKRARQAAEGKVEKDNEAGVPKAVTEPKKSTANTDSSAAPDAGEEPKAKDEVEEPVGRKTKRLGLVWLMAVGALFMVRLLLDPTMVRRPLLEPNLSSEGLAFIGCALFVFLMANVVNSPIQPGTVLAEQAVEQTPLETGAGSGGNERKLRPGYQLLAYLPSVPTISDLSNEQASHTPLAYRASQLLAILSQLAIVMGMVFIGYLHFNNIKMGVGAAAMYLMLPYTAQMTGQVHHAFPAALLVWAVVCYRRPFTAGILMGLSVTAYYPLFLLPLWMSFYWQRGLRRFLCGVGLTLLALALGLLTVSASASDYFFLLRKMFGLMFRMKELSGVWGLGWYPIYRIPLLAAFGALCGTLALWPAQKNLGTLLSCSGAVLVASQFWSGDGGGLYMAWYLPLVLLTIFRPNLEDRVALSVLGEGWFPRRTTAAEKNAA